MFNSRDWLRPGGRYASFPIIEPARLYDEPQTAELLDISIKELRRCADAGEGPFPLRLHLHARPRYHGADILAKLAGKRG